MNGYPTKNLQKIAQAVAENDEIGVRVAVIETLALYLIDIRRIANATTFLAKQVNGGE